MIEGILALMDEPELHQEIGWIAQPGHVAIEHSSGGVPDRELFDQFGIMHAAAVQVIHTLGMAAELLLVKVDSFPKSFILPRLGQTEMLFQVNKSLTKREIQQKLDEANEVAATAAAVAVEDILGGIDIEGRVSFRMQGT
ncbi:MAG: hypothetical protein ABSC02_14835 [Acidobacteriota bacterium]